MRKNFSTFLVIRSDFVTISNRLTLDDFGAQNIRRALRTTGMGRYINRCIP